MSSGLHGTFNLSTVAFSVHLHACEMNDIVSTTQCWSSWRINSLIWITWLMDNICCARKHVRQCWILCEHVKGFGPVTEILYLLTILFMNFTFLDWFLSVLQKVNLTKWCLIWFIFWCHLYLLAFWQQWIFAKGEQYRFHRLMLCCQEVVFVLEWKTNV